VWNKKYYHQYTIFVLITVSLFTLSIMACGGTIHRAEYVQKDRIATIAVELLSSHPFLAEYDRFVVLTLNGKEVSRKNFSLKLAAMRHRTCIGAT
jgi:hypothetical protein